MISCKNSTNINTVIDWLVKHSKSKNWSLKVPVIFQLVIIISYSCFFLQGGQYDFAVCLTEFVDVWRHCLNFPTCLVSKVLYICLVGESGIKLFDPFYVHILPRKHGKCVVVLNQIKEFWCIFSSVLWQSHVFVNY